jgi:hypothetical protein
MPANAWGQDPKRAKIVRKQIRDAKKAERSHKASQKARKKK